MIYLGNIGITGYKYFKGHNSFFQVGFQRTVSFKIFTTQYNYEVLNSVPLIVQGSGDLR